MNNGKLRTLDDWRPMEENTKRTDEDSTHFRRAVKFQSVCTVASVGAGRKDLGQRNYHEC